MLGTRKSALLPRNPGSPPPRAGSPPDSPPQVARFSVSRAVSHPASRPPARANRPTSAESRALRSRAEISGFQFFRIRGWGCKFARNTGKNYRVNSGTVHQNAPDITSQQASRYRPATVRAPVGFGSSSGDPKPLCMMGFSEYTGEKYRLIWEH